MLLDRNVWPGLLTCSAGAQEVAELRNKLVLISGECEPPGVQIMQGRCCPQ